MNHSATVRGLTFSLDACWIATWSDDGIARVFETATGKEVSRLNHRDSIVAAAFSLDGRYLITVSSGVADRRLVIISHQLRTEDLVAEVHARLTRNLTLDEWHQYIGNEPYRKTCPNLPEGQ
jgi:WD40 repeat protein